MKTLSDITHKRTKIPIKYFDAYDLETKQMIKIKGVLFIDDRSKTVIFRKIDAKKFTYDDVA